MATKKRHLSVYRHPTIILLIDDNDSFVNSVVIQMNPLIHVKSFRDAADAVVWLNEMYRPR